MIRNIFKKLRCFLHVLSLLQLLFKLKKKNSKVNTRHALAIVFTLVNPGALPLIFTERFCSKDLCNPQRNLASNLWLKWSKRTLRGIETFFFFITSTARTRIKFIRGNLVFGKIGTRVSSARNSNWLELNQSFAWHRSWASNHTAKNTDIPHLAPCAAKKIKCGKEECNVVNWGACVCVLCVVSRTIVYFLPDEKTRSHNKILQTKQKLALKSQW